MTLASMGGRMRNSLYLFIVALSLILGSGLGVRAASITVDTSCSLPDAIIAANTDRQAGAVRRAAATTPSPCQAMWKSSTGRLTLRQNSR